MSELLRIENVTVRFDGLVALHDVGLAVEAGTVLGVIGPNGAGKTTMFNVACGFVRPSHGVIRWCGDELRVHAPHHLAGLGIARTLQGLGLFPGLTVLENVLVGAGRLSCSGPLSTPLGVRKRVALARALVGEPLLLLLDEPASGLAADEIAELGDRILAFAAHAAVVVVEHNMDLVMRICDRVVVLDFGEVIATGTPEEIRSDPRVVEAYLGVPV